MTSDALDRLASADRLPDLSGVLHRVLGNGFVAEFVSWGFFRPRPWRNYWHSHSYYEVCLAYAGRGCFRHAEREAVVQRGDVFVARPPKVHEIETWPDAPLGIAFWGFTVQPDDPGGNSGWVSGLVDGPDVSQRLGRLPELLTSLAAEAAQPRSGYEAICAGLGAALVVETGRAFAPVAALRVPVDLPDRDTQVVATIRRYLSDNLARPIAVRDIAAAVHLSERHTERLFTEQTGESLMSALRRLRLDQAGRLLLEESRPTSEIARACGYADLSAFRTAFRRHHGQPPQAFRANRGTLHVTAS